jgi:hypothetical protein
MTFVNSLRAAVDRARAIPGRLGLRQHVITKITRTWSTAIIGHGSYTDVETVLLVGGQNPRARQVTESARDHYLETGPTFSEGDWLVGPLTPEFDGGGYDADTFEAGESAVEIFYKIDGPGVSADERFQAKSKSTDKPFRYTLVLQRAPMTP